MTKTEVKNGFHPIILHGSNFLTQGFFPLKTRLKSSEKPGNIKLTMVSPLCYPLSLRKGNTFQKSSRDSISSPHVYTQPDLVLEDRHDLPATSSPVFSQLCAGLLLQTTRRVSERGPSENSQPLSPSQELSTLCPSALRYTENPVYPSRFRKISMTTCLMMPLLNVDTPLPSI